MVWQVSYEHHLDHDIASSPNEQLQCHVGDLELLHSLVLYCVYTGTYNRASTVRFSTARF